MGVLKEFGGFDYKFPSLAILFSHMMDDLSYPLSYGYITYSWILIIITILINEYIFRTRERYQDWD